jgi:hypothetical protein
VLALFAGAPVFAAQGGSIQKKSCSVHWSEPHPVRVGHNTVFVERAASVSLHERAFFVGPRAFVYDSLGHPVQPLVPPGARYIESFDEIAMGAISNGHGAWNWVSEPPHARSMPWYPEAVADSAGIAHVVWASSDTVEQVSPPTAPSIWYARFDGRHWSEPVHIASGHQFYWTSSSVSQLLLVGRTLHFAVATPGKGISYFRGSGSRWKVSVVGIDPTFTGYPSLAVLPAGRIVLVIQGGSPGANNGISSSVYATHSDDGGDTWTPPQRISSAASEPAFDFQLRRSPAGALHVVWFQQTDSLGRPAPRPNLGNSPGRIQMAESNDAGVSWHALPPTSLLANADGLQLLQTPNGSLIATVADRVAEKVFVTQWNGRWLPFGKIDASGNPFHPALGWGDAQRPILTWGSRRTHDRYTTWMTTLTPCP